MPKTNICVFVSITLYMKKSIKRQKKSLLKITGFNMFYTFTPFLIICPGRLQMIVRI